MKKLILAQVLTTNGTAECSGLYDENGDPVTVEIEKDDSGVSLTIWQNTEERERRDCGISEEEIQRTCGNSRVSANLAQRSFHIPLFEELLFAAFKKQLTGFTVSHLNFTCLDNDVT